MHFGIFRVTGTMCKAVKLTTAEKKTTLRLWKTILIHSKIVEDGESGKGTVARVVQAFGTSVPPFKSGGSVKIDSKTQRLYIRKVSSKAEGAKIAYDCSLPLE